MSKKRLTKPQKQSDPQHLFQKWWFKAGLKQTEKMVANYLKQNPDYDPEDYDGSDASCVHRMMHEGEAENMIYDAAEEAFIQGFNNQEFNSSSFYCELDNVVDLAYKAGKLVNGN